MSFVIVLRTQQGKREIVVWLGTVLPEQWGERERAMRFGTRGEARRASEAIKLSGDWSIEPGPNPTAHGSLTMIKET
jgi:hypothetical protein